jgi:hypothetical protein
MQLKHHESENKPHTRRGGKDNPPTGGPRRGNAGNSAKPTSATRYAIYGGAGTDTDRLGSFRIDGDAFTAFDKRGIEIGTFATQNEAIVAIERGAKS